MHKFTYNQEKDRIELGTTGLQVAVRDTANQFTPDCDPKIGAPIALHLINGMSRKHECRWGNGSDIAARLTEGNFGDTPQWKQDRNNGEKFTLEYSEYSDTIRIAELNTMVMKRDQDKRWTFDFDSAGDEPLLQKTFLLFHRNQDLRGASGPEMLEALTNSKPKYDNAQELSH